MWLESKIAHNALNLPNHNKRLLDWTWMRTVRAWPDIFTALTNLMERNVFRMGASPSARTLMMWMTSVDHQSTSTHVIFNTSHVRKYGLAFQGSL